MEPVARTLAVPGAPSLACMEWDDGENLPVMALLTDSGCPANAMADMAASFGGEYRIVAPLPDADDEELDEARLTALLRACGADALVIAQGAHGRTALHVAARSPNLVRALVLVETPLHAARGLNPHVGQPVLLIRGSCSRALTHADAVALSELLGRCRLAEIENSGEWPQAMPPEAFDAALRWFLAGSTDGDLFGPPAG